MAYTPKLSDINPSVLHKYDSNISQQYQPSISDVDPSILHKYDNPTQQGQANNSFLSTIPSDAQNMLYGIGDAMAKVPVGVANLIPGVHLQNPKFGSGTVYDIGQDEGDVLGFLAGGDAADALRGAVAGAKALPGAISNAAEWLGKSGWLPGTTKRAIGSAGYGAVTNPNERASGALEGGALSAVLDTAPLASMGIKKVSDQFNPSLKLNDVVKTLGGGQTLEDNAKSLAQYIKSSYESQKQQGNALYQPIFDAIGNSSIYDKGALKNVSSNSPVIPNIGSTISHSNKLENSEYNSIVDKIKKNFTSDVSDLNSDFLKNPTFQNAHDLRSQLSYTIRDLNNAKAKGNLGIADLKALNALQKGKNALNSDMTNFLNKQDSSLASDYINANNFWRDNVAPYRSSPTISRIANGKVTNPKNIANIFKSPEPEINKVVSDLPDDAKNKILYSLLGKTNATQSPENFVKAFSALNNAGHTSYASPELTEKVNDLTSTISNRNDIEKLLGAITGASLGHSLGISPGVSEIVGGGSGYLLGPKLYKKIAQIPGLKNAYNAISNSISQSYPSLSNILKGISIPEG